MLIYGERNTFQWKWSPSSGHLRNCTFNPLKAEQHQAAERRVVHSARVQLGHISSKTNIKAQWELQNIQHTTGNWTQIFLTWFASWFYNFPLKQSGIEFVAGKLKEFSACMIYTHQGNNHMHLCPGFYQDGLELQALMHISSHFSWIRPSYSKTHTSLLFDTQSSVLELMVTRADLSFWCGVLRPIFIGLEFIGGRGAALIAHLLNILKDEAYPCPRPPLSTLFIFIFHQNVEAASRKDTHACWRRDLRSSARLKCQVVNGSIEHPCKTSLSFRDRSSQRIWVTAQKWHITLIYPQLGIDSCLVLHVKTELWMRIQPCVGFIV